jgi:prepilin-type N-terminal cleavage/methylation domain-containing protein
MKRTANSRAFTLVEILVAAAVLLIIVALASQMTSATLATVTHSTHTLDTSESVRAATMLLRDELSGVIASERRGRFLNLRVTENDKGVALYFTVPRAQAGDLTRMGFVTHVAYVWDRETRTLGRAEYHSSREPEFVAATASSADSKDAAANLARLRDITPAYQGREPYAWTEQKFWETRLEEARRNPLLTGVAEWKIEAFETGYLDGDEPVKNKWEQPGKLPAVLRFTFVINTQQRVVAEKGAEERERRRTAGRSYVSIVPLPGAEVPR